MDWYRAQDTFSAELDGTPVTVVKGEPFPENHPLVEHDRKSAEAAGKAGTERVRLFKLMDAGAPEPEKPEPKSRSSRAKM